MGSNAHVGNFVEVHKVQFKNASFWHLPKSQSMNYLMDCELHKKRSSFGQTEAVVYQKPPSFCPLPLAQWFETVHANEILAHVNEMRGVITSTYGRILKMDSTKKVGIITF